MQDLCTAKDLAKFLGGSVAKVRKDTRLTALPKIYIGTSVRYDREQVLSWLRSRQEQERNGAAAEVGVAGDASKH